jgi:hypothetical protein
MTEEAFMAAVTAHHPVAPTYFAVAAATNPRPHELLDQRAAPEALSLDQVSATRGRRRRARRSLAPGLRLRTPGGSAQREPGRALRRVRRKCDPPPAGHHRGGRPGPGDRGQEPPGSHRLRHRGRLPAPHRSGVGGPPPPGRAGRPTARRRTGRVELDRPPPAADRCSRPFRAPGRQHHRCPPPAPARAARPRPPARPGPADGGVLRVRQPLLGRRLPTAGPRLRLGGRRVRRLRRLGRRRITSHPPQG